MMINDCFILICLDCYNNQYTITFNILLRFYKCNLLADKVVHIFGCNLLLRHFLKVSLVIYYPLKNTLNSKKRAKLNNRTTSISPSKTTPKMH